MIKSDVMVDTTLQLPTCGTPGTSPINIVLNNVNVSVEMLVVPFSKHLVLVYLKLIQCQWGTSGGRLIFIPLLCVILFQESEDMS